MFGKMQDMLKLKKQADEMKKQLAGEIIKAENHGVKVTMNGNQEVLSVETNPELGKEKLEDTLKDVFNDALKKVQRVMASKMAAGGGFGF